MADTFLYPALPFTNGLNGASTYGYTTGAATDHADAIDDWSAGFPGNIDLTDYIFIATDGSTTYHAEMELAGLPADFGGASGALGSVIKHHLHFSIITENDSVSAWYDLVDSAGTSVFTLGERQSINLANGQHTTESEPNTRTQTITSSIDTSKLETLAQWQDLRLRIRAEYSNNMGADGIAEPFKIYAVGIEVQNYVQAVVDTVVEPAAGSVLITGQTPAWEAKTSRLEPAPGSLLITGQTPQFFPVNVQPQVLVITGSTPKILTAIISRPPAGGLILTGQAPVFSSPPVPYFLDGYPTTAFISAATGGELMMASIPCYWEETDGTSVENLRTTTWRYGAFDSQDMATLAVHYSDDDTRFNNAMQFSSAGNTETTLDTTLDPLGNRSSSGTFYGWTGCVDYSCFNGGRDWQYQCGAVTWHIDTTSTSDFAWFNFVVKNGTSRTTNFQVDVGTVPWYTANEAENWPANFYGRDVKNDLGWLVALRVSGGDTLPCLHQWQGGTTWGAAVDLLASTDEPVDFTTRIIGWCRADTVNRDRIYVLVTTENASTGAFLNFRVLAVDLTNIAARTTVFIDSTNYGNDVWYLSGEGTGIIYTSSQSPAHRMIRQGTTAFEERCTPLTIDGNSFFFFRTHSSTGDRQYTKLALNDADWLSISLTSFNANLPGPPRFVPAAAANTVSDFETHAIVYNPETGVLLAVATNTAWDSDYTLHRNGSYYQSFRWASYRDLLDPVDTFSEYRIFDAFQDSFVSGWEKILFHIKSASRNWGHTPGGSPRGVVSYLSTGVRQNLSRSVRTFTLLKPHKDRFDPVSRVEKRDFRPKLQVDIQPTVIEATVRYEGVLAVGLKPLDITAGVAVGSSYSTAGKYTLKDTTASTLSVLMDLQPTITIAFEGEVAVEVDLDMDFRTSAAFEVSLLVRQFLDHRASYVYFGQAWTDELIGLVNTRRAGLSLPAVASIAVTRYEANQNGIDAFDINARNMARLDTLAFDDPGFTSGYVTPQDRIERINPLDSAFTTARTRFLDDIGLLIEDSNFPSATYLWNTRSWETTYANFWDYNLGAGNTELYLQVGIGIAPSADDATQENVIFVSLALTAYDGMPFEGFGGGGGGGGDPGGEVEVTPTADTKTFRSTYIYEGTSWHEEFLSYVNTLREEEGRPPLLIPDTSFWGKYTLHSTQIHAQNCVEAQLMAHDSPNLPPGFQTLDQRAEKEGFRLTTTENILARVNNAVFPLNDNYDTGSSLFPSPKEAYDLWVNSAGHRGNMVRGYGPAEGTAYNIIGIGLKYFSESYVFADEFNGVGLPGIIGWSLILNNVFVRIEDIMIYRHFNTNYQLDGSLIELLINSYPLTAYSDVRADHESLYSIRVAATHTIPYVQKVTRAHRSPIQYGVRQAHTALYVSSTPVAAQHTASFRVRDTVDVAADHTASYSASVKASHKAELPNLLQLIASHEARYEDLSRIYTDHASPVAYTVRAKGQHEALVTALVNIKAAHTALYEPAVKVKTDHTVDLFQLGRLSKDHTAPLEPMVKVQASHAANYTALSRSRKQHEALFSGLNKVTVAHVAPYFSTTPVAVQFSAVFDLLAQNRVVAAHNSFYSIRTADTVIVAGGISLTTGGKKIDMTDLVISQEEQTPAWFCRARIARIEDFVAIARGATAVVDIQGEQWTLVITETQIDRVFGELDMKVNMQSPVVSLMSPRAVAQDYSFSAATSARAIVEEILGQQVEWSILDWIVPADRFVVSGSTPYEAALTLVNVAGALIQSKANGALEVRYTYPRAMNTLAASAPDHTFTDIQDNLKATEGFDFRTGVNAIRLLEGEATYADNFQWVPEPDDETKGTLRAHLSPWRENVVVRSTGGPVLASLTLQGVTEREETQFVEFTGGTARLSYPIKAIVSVDWISDSLGAVTFEAGTASLNASALVNSGYGYAEVVYKVQSLDHYVSGSLGDSEQFIIEDGS